MRTPLSKESHISKMLKLLAVLGLAAVCFGSPLGELSGDAKLSPPIVGGKPVDIEDFPYQLAFNSGGGFCGASIISKNWVLTAAHCTTGTAVSRMSLRAGSSNYNKGGTVHNVIKKIEHPNYKASGHDYDFTLLEVDPPFAFGSGVAAIPLVADGVELAAGTSTVVSGWGTTSFGGSTLPSQLQAVEVPLVSASECKGVYGSTITDRMICAGAPQGGKDSCQGDSGGPLEAQGKLAGVVSFGSGCGDKGTPGVYGKVSSVRPWIKQNSGV